jgi:hypothetical protein
MRDTINHFVCINPPARAPPITSHVPHPNVSTKNREAADGLSLTSALRKPTEPFHAAFSRTRMHFPDKRLIQWDCGKLQVTNFHDWRAFVLFVSPMLRSFECGESYCRCRVRGSHPPPHTTPPPPVFTHIRKNWC